MLLYRLGTSMTDLHCSVSVCPTYVRIMFIRIFPVVIVIYSLAYTHLALYTASNLILKNLAYTDGAQRIHAWKSVYSPMYGFWFFETISCNANFALGTLIHKAILTVLTRTSLQFRLNNTNKRSSTASIWNKVNDVNSDVKSFLIFYFYSLNVLKLAVLYMYT